MSAYNVVWPSFWDSRTGRALVADNKAGHAEGLITALYLMTCKHTNMLGCFSMPLPYIERDSGLSEAAARAGLARLAELDFLVWDPRSEFVWVKEMARYRLGLDTKKPSLQDNRVSNIRQTYLGLPSAELVEGIFEHYGKALQLAKRAMKAEPLPSPFEAPSKGQTTARGTVQDSTVQDSTKSVEPRSLSQRPERRRSVDRASGDHPSHAFCSPRYCVPRTLHDELQGQVGGAAVSLLKWYADTIAALGDRPCVEPLFKFWKTRFARDIVPKLRVAGAVDMLPEREGGNRPMDRMHERGRAAARSAPITKRTFTKKAAGA